MSFEINPVLAGKYDAPDYAPANNYASATNISTPTDITGSGGASSTNATNDVTGPDPRRYTQFDRTIIDAGETTNFTFADFLDLINPLEHIPIVSSIYRSITGEHINPISRVAGDIIYGGLLGAASAVLGGVGAIADAGLEAETGKDSGGLVVAALFGDDGNMATPDGGTTGSIQLADAGTTIKSSTTSPSDSQQQTPSTQNIEIAQAATPTPLLAALSIPTGTVAPPVVPPSQAAAAPSAPVTEPSPPPPAQVIAAPAPASPLPPAVPTSAPVPAVQAVAPQINANSPTLSADLVAVVNGAANSQPLTAAAAIPSRGLNKLPYGGVMNPTVATQAQDMALALAQGTPGVRMGHMIYANKTMNGARALQPMLSSGMKTNAATAPVVAPAPVLPATKTSVSAISPAPSHAFQTLVSTSNVLSPSASDPTAAPLLQGMMLKALGQYGSAGNKAALGNNINIMN